MPVSWSSTSAILYFFLFLKVIADASRVESNATRGRNTVWVVNLIQIYILVLSFYYCVGYVFMYACSFLHIFTYLYVYCLFIRFISSRWIIQHTCAFTYIYTTNSCTHFLCTICTTSNIFVCIYVSIFYLLWIRSVVLVKSCQHLQRWHAWTYWLAIYWRMQ